MRYRRLDLGATLAFGILAVFSAHEAVWASADIPFYAQSKVPPNILIILDNSGSMSRNCIVGSTVGNLDGIGYSSGGNCSPSNPYTRLDTAYRVMYDVLNADKSIPSGKTTSYPTTDVEANSSDYINNITTSDQATLEVRLGFELYGPSTYTGAVYSNSSVHILKQIWGTSSNDPNQNNFGLNTTTLPAYRDIWNTIRAISPGNNPTPLAKSLDIARTPPGSAFFPVAATGDAGAACRDKAVIVITDGEDTTANSGTGNIPSYYCTTPNGAGTSCTSGCSNPNNGGTYKAEGWPGCNNPGQIARHNASIQAATDLMAEDIRTFVVGFGMSGSDPHLVDLRAAMNSMASAGGTDAALFADDSSQLYNAIVSAIAQAKAGSYTRSAPVVAASGGRLYLGYYDLPYWKGHLQAYKVGNDGVVDTSSYVFDSGEKIKTFGRGTVYTADKASGGGPSACDSASNAWAIQFVDTNATLTSGGCATALHGGLDIDGVGGAGTGDDAKAVINLVLKPTYGAASAPYPYLGQRDANGWLLGDVFYSRPVVVGVPNQFYDKIDSSYTAFRTAWKERETRIFVGANDGMLHSLRGGKSDYDFATGKWTYSGETGLEAWAYIPNAVLGKLRDLRTDHAFLVDGSPVAADVYIKSEGCDDGAGPCWRTVLVSGLRKGGNKYFALDVTKDTVGPLVLWETGESNMGETWSRPAIGRAGDSTWYAFVGGGYSAASNVGNRVYAIDLNTGNIGYEGTVTDLADADGIKNAVPGAVRAAGRNYGSTDVVYFGDLEGKIWRLDVSNSNPTKWVLSILFDPYDSTNGGDLTSSPRRPIYSAPSIAYFIPKGETAAKFHLAFGTGNELDPTDATVQNYFFLVKDPNDPGTAEGDLEPGVLVWRTGPSGKIAALSAGEKIFADSLIYGGYVYFTTYTPNSDICSIGSSELNAVALQADESGNYASQIFDVGSGLASSPVVTQTPGSQKAQITVATSAGGETGSELIKQVEALGSLPSSKVESWREIF